MKFSLICITYCLDDQCLCNENLNMFKNQKSAQFLATASPFLISSINAYAHVHSVWIFFIYRMEFKSDKKGNMLLSNMDLFLVEDEYTIPLYLGYFHLFVLNQFSDRPSSVTLTAHISYFISKFCLLQ